MSAPERIHEVKCWAEFFDGLRDGSKTFEVRRNDRDYQPGDTLHVREWVPFLLANNEHYTGRDVWLWVRYVLGGGQHGIEEGYVVMSVQRALCLNSRDVQTPYCRLWRGHEGEHENDFRTRWP